MKIRSTIIVLLLLLTSAKSYGQDVKKDSIPPVANDTSIVTATADTLSGKDTIIIRPIERPRLKIGARTGINVADMVYSHEPLGRYEHSKRNIGMLGIFAEAPIGRTPLSVRPEITMTARGTKLNWLDVNYDFLANYVDLRLPITWNFQFLGEKFVPYLMVAPQLNLPYGGEITYYADDFTPSVSTSISKADLRGADVSVMFGTGIDLRFDMDKMPIYLSLEVGYSLGLFNNFAKRERYETTENPSNILNNFFGAELWKGSRHTRGLELALRLSLPIDKEYLEHYRNLRKGIPDTVRVIEKSYDTIINPNDTIIIEAERDLPELRSKVTTAYQTKECFTIAELYNLMEQGVDIAGKRICMFDIKFDFDSYKIRKESERPLNELVQMMHDYPRMTVEVYGHTDSIGTAEYNQRLSENRAKAVVEYLGKHGISPSRVRSFGYGLNYPIDSNATEEGRFRNRRVEFEVITIGLSRKYNK